MKQARTISAVLGIVMLMLTGPNLAQAQQIHRQPFETRETLFIKGQADATIRVLAHDSVEAMARAGQYAEHVQLVSEQGSYIYFYYPVGKAPLSDELSLNLFVKGNRPGAQILARVVLPRERNPKNLDEPLTTYIRGDVYQQVGRWQRMEVRRPSILGRKQQQLMRAQMQRDVDFTDAYVDQVVLNAYSGPGMTELWMDDLEIGPVTEPTPFRTTGRGSGVRLEPPGAAPKTTTRTNVVEVVHDQIQVNHKRFLLRGIRHTDTPLKTLRDAGLNAIWVNQTTPAETLDEAINLGFLLVPMIPAGGTDPNLTSTDAFQQSVRLFVERDATLMWDLGGGLTDEQTDQVGQVARLIRNADPHRPLAADVWDGYRVYARNVDLVGAHRWPLMTSLELPQYRHWLEQRRLLGRSGQYMWTWIQTHLPEWYTTLVYERPAAAGFQEPIGPQPEQIRLLTYLSLAAGCRGLGFWSDRFLADSHQGRDRLLAIALLNLELRLLEPFLLTAEEPTWIDTSEKEVKAAVFRTASGLLVLPMWLGRGAQYVPGQSAATRLTLIIPQTPVGTQPWEVSPAEVRSLRPERVVGGTKLVIPEFGLTTAIVFTADNGPGGVLDKMQMQIKQMNRLAAQWSAQMAEEELRKVTLVYDQLVQAGHRLPDGDGLLAKAKQFTQSAAAYYNQGQYREAYWEAQRAVRPLRILMRVEWEEAVKPLSTPVASPFALSYFSLPQHWQLWEAVQKSQPGANVLPHGDFETNLEGGDDGWAAQEARLDEVVMAARRVEEEPQQGRHALVLQISPKDPQNTPAALERSFLAVTSPAVRLQPGSWVRVSGWLRIPKPITGSVDGALLYDSAGGEPLAIRMTDATPWKQFVLYRRVPPSGSMSITLALTGLGSVYFDDVRIEPLLAEAASNTP